MTFEKVEDQNIRHTPVCVCVTSNFKQMHIYKLWAGFMSGLNKCY